MRSEGAIEIFGPLFQPSIKVFIDQLKNSVYNSYDIFAVLLMLAINEKNKKILTERGCKALDNYFSQVSMILWPKF